MKWVTLLLVGLLGTVLGTVIRFGLVLSYLGVLGIGFVILLVWKDATPLVAIAVVGLALSSMWKERRHGTTK